MTGEGTNKCFTVIVGLTLSDDVGQALPAKGVPAVVQSKRDANDVLTYLTRPVFLLTQLPD